MSRQAKSRQTELDKVAVSDVEIRALLRADVPETRHVLARSFDDDPFFIWLFPAPVRRFLALRNFMGSSTADTIKFGHAYAAVENGRIVGSAAWLPPGAYPLTPGRQIRQLVTIAGIAPLFPLRLTKGLGLLAAMTKAHPKEEHWYLYVLGVDPARWRRGIGGQLMAPVLDQVDREGLPCYLETQNESNLAFYGRYGWEVRDVLQLPGCPPLWTMWREPQKA
jgi:GNAT superfamily N-acetyltransferase